MGRAVVGVVGTAVLWQQVAAAAIGLSIEGGVGSVIESPRTRGLALAGILVLISKYKLYKNSKYTKLLNQ